MVEYDRRVSDLLALIATYDDAWNRQDVAAISSMHAPDVVFHNHTAGERVEGRDAVAAHIAGIFERWPTLRFRGRGQRAGHDFVVSEWTASATHPDRYLVIQKWESPEAQRAHFDSALMVGFAEDCRGLLAGPPRIDLHDAISAHDVS